MNLNNINRDYVFLISEQKVETYFSNEDTIGQCHYRNNIYTHFSDSLIKEVYKKFFRL